MDIEQALTLPLAVVKLPIAWHGEPVGPECCAPIVFNAGAAFLPAYLSGGLAVIFALNPAATLNSAKFLAAEAISLFCI
ncbi:MAG: hypothetical protein ACTHLA_04865 [Asticcacaulis sp.]|uniref:hypothetical protein n=1 Tax=Asticcacaulis sp. TaxID=1872648 RepID=UPI003F7C4966